MHKLKVIALVAALTMAAGLSPATSQAASPVDVTAPADADHRLLAVGAGAIVGIVAFNMLTYPLGSVPFAAGPLAATPMDIALGSRLLATMTGGAGALLAHYLYPLWGESTPPAQ